MSVTTDKTQLKQRSKALRKEKSTLCFKIQNTGYDTKISISFENGILSAFTTSGKGELEVQSFSKTATMYPATMQQLD